MINDSLAWEYPTPYVKLLQVAPEQIDRLGHTNNVNYLAWLELIAWEHIESLGYGWSEMERSGYALAITQTQLSYRIATFAGDDLILGTWITYNDERFKCGRGFQLIRPKDNKTILTANMDFACISLKNNRPAKMPGLMISVLNNGLIRQI